MPRNCLLKRVIDGKTEGSIEVKLTRGRRRKKLIENFQGKESYWKLKKEALDPNTGELALVEMWVYRDGDCRMTTTSSREGVV